METMSIYSFMANFWAFGGILSLNLGFLRLFMGFPQNRQYHDSKFYLKVHDLRNCKHNHYEGLVLVFKLFWAYRGQILDFSAYFC